MRSVDQLLAEVLALPVSVRARLALELNQSLEPEGKDISPKEWEAAWAPVLDRRAAELKAGTVEAVPWGDAMRQLRTELPPQ
jgi:putative addiction module component (TIGR02574 family)